MSQLDIINAVLQDFKQANNRCANSLSEITPKLSEESRSKKVEFQIDNSRNVVDPTGTAYVLDRENCTANIAVNSAIPKS